MSIFGKAPKSATAETVKAISKLNISDKIKPAKTRFGRYLNNKKIAKFEKAKLDAIKHIGKGVVGRGTEIAKTFIAAKTAEELNRPTYSQGLAAWTKNISGNPDPEKGDNGQTQEGSTSELGG